MTGKRYLGLAALIAGVYAALSPIWTIIVYVPLLVSVGLFVQIGDNAA